MLLLNMKHWTRITLVIVALVLAYCSVRKAYVLRATYMPTSEQVDVLANLGKEAISSGDVPVAALLLYNDDVIGRGYNTVRRDGNAGGHAEVNAISDAFRSLGWERFERLDRDRMVLLTTFEPCAMCKGLICQIPDRARGIHRAEIGVALDEGGCALDPL
ncbi:MAG: nucleoside deaminase [Flavobacteriales bacterium]|nr:nucleoside deaminase [Flavobacteriales bacterium]